MELNNRQSYILTAFILISLLLHWVFLYLTPVPKREASPARKPVVVEVRPPEPEKPEESEEEVRDKLNNRELDLPPVQQEEQPRKTPAKRLAEQNRQVPKETAPKGEAPEDRAPSAQASPPAQAPRTSPPKEAPTPKPKQKTAKIQPKESPRGERPSAASSEPALKAPQGPLSPTQQPSLESLLKLPKATVARLEDEWRRKYRKDVEEGNAVWLDTERDILISFFRRFRDNIYGVWNYPARERELGRQGTCLLKVTINHDGSLQRVVLLESSGVPSLDNEAMTAVQEAAPFGSLPRAYTEEDLTIFAFFEYKLGFTRKIY